MGKSVLVFVSHASEDKESYIDPIVRDLENCYINIWIDRKNILPGDNLRKSILRDGINKADIVLIFFTEQSLRSAWVDREIKHILREETQKGNDFDLSKIISIFDSIDTYEKIKDRYSELTDDLLHLMPKEYTKIQVGQLISAIWSKYLGLQGGDIATQRQILEKDREIFKKDKIIHDLNEKIITLQNSITQSTENLDFEEILKSGKIDDFLENHSHVLSSRIHNKSAVPQIDCAVAFGIMEHGAHQTVSLTPKGVGFLKWWLLKKQHTSN